MEQLKLAKSIFELYGEEILTKAKPTTTKTQTIIFEKDKFDLTEAKKWLKEKDFKVPEVDETEDSYRFRQLPLDSFQEDTFRTIELKPGVKAVIGRPKKL